ncbi:MAG: caspase family protein, partial [Desulfobacula sp.]|nr:caspase family protein [Desulfobacula sp.]
LKYGGDREKVESILGGNFFNIDHLRTIAPPKIAIISPLYSEIFPSNTNVTLKLSVESNSLDMLHYSVFVNNIPVTPSTERDLHGSDKRSFVKEMNIPLFDRKNKIRVEVFNGKSMGLAETIVYKEGTVTTKDNGNLYILSIGVNEFSDMPSNNLSFAADDAKGLEEYYRNEEGKFFEHVFTKSISDLSATKPSKDNIVKSLEFIKNANAGDTIIVFLASHGLSDPAGNYYFAPSDASTQDVTKLITGSVRGATETFTNLSSLISWEIFFDALRSVPGKRLLVVDTCQAKNIAGTFDIHSLAKRSATSSFALLAASKGNEESQEYPTGNHGLFTYALLKGLTGDGDSNRDGRVVLSELYEFVSRFVENNRDKEIGNQTPQLTAPKELKEMVLVAQ